MVSYYEWVELMLIASFILLASYVIMGIYIGFKFCSLNKNIFIASLLFLIFKLAELGWSLIYFTAVSELCDILTEDYTGLIVALSVLIGIVASVIAYIITVIILKLNSSVVIYRVVFSVLLLILPIIMAVIFNNFDSLYELRTVISFGIPIYYVMLVVTFITIYTLQAIQKNKPKKQQADNTEIEQTK